MVQVSHPKVAAVLTDAAGDAIMGGTLHASNNRTDNLPVGLYVSTGAGGVWQPVMSAYGRGDANDGSYIAAQHSYNYNNTTWDRQRGNIRSTALSLAARTVATDTGSITNYNARGVLCFINITAWTAGSITVSLQGYDAGNATWVTLGSTAALAAIANTYFAVYPGVAAVANVAISLPIPREWRMSVAVGSADSITYSISYTMIV